MPSRGLVRQAPAGLTPRPLIVSCLTGGEIPAVCAPCDAPLFVWRDRSGLWTAGLRASKSAASGTISRVGQDIRARMAKLADAADLKSAGRKAVGVQVPLRAPTKQTSYMQNGLP